MKTIIVLIYLIHTVKTRKLRSKCRHCYFFKKCRYRIWSFQLFQQICVFSGHRFRGRGLCWYRYPWTFDLDIQCGHNKIRESRHEPSIKGITAGCDNHRYNRVIKLIRTSENYEDQIVILKFTPQKVLTSVNFI